MMTRTCFKKGKNRGTMISEGNVKRNVEGKRNTKIRDGGWRDKCDIRWMGISENDAGNRVSVNAELGWLPPGA